MYGINLNGINYWAAECPFVDLHKTARPWVTQTNSKYNTREHHLLDLDEKGWVKSLPRPNDSRVEYRYVATEFTFDAACQGRYVLKYDGKGEAVLTGQYSNVEKRKGEVHFDVSMPGSVGTGKVGYVIRETDPNDYIRNVTCRPVGASPNEIFTRVFLDSVKKYDYIRFMDWNATNNSPKSSIDHATPIDYYTYTSYGVPYQRQIDLANELNVVPWFCLPHLIDNPAAEKIAMLIQRRLKKDLPFYLEYSNEVWNFQFDQAKWAQTMAEQTGLRNNHQFYAKRSSELIGIFKSVFADEPERVIGVLSAQAANSWTFKQMHPQNWDSNWPNRSIEEYGFQKIAIAPYFGGYIGKSDNQPTLETWARNPRMGLDQLFAEIEEGRVLNSSNPNSALDVAYNNMRAYRKIAKEIGFDLVAYEGGQHLATHGYNTQSVVDLFIAANIDPRMKRVYKAYFKTWFELKGKEFMVFAHVGSYGKSGSWGLQRYYNSGDPKEAAICELIEEGNN